MWRLAAVVAFLQAGATLGGFLTVLLQGRTRGFSPWSFTDLLTLIGLGVALYGRHVWAAYALTGYSALNIVFKVHAGTPPWFDVLVLVLYAGAAVHLRSVEHSAPSLGDLPWKRLVIFALVLYGGTFAISVLWTWPFHLTKDSTLYFFVLMVWALLLFTRVAIRTSPWSFECVLLVVLLSWPLGVIDWAWGMMSALQWVASIVYLLAFGMCGWGAGAIAILAGRAVRHAAGSGSRGPAVPSA